MLPWLQGWRWEGTADILEAPPTSTVENSSTHLFLRMKRVTVWRIKISEYIHKLKITAQSSHISNKGPLTLSVPPGCIDIFKCESGGPLEAPVSFVLAPGESERSFSCWWNALHTIQLDILLAIKKLHTLLHDPLSLCREENCRWCGRNWNAWQRPAENEW